MKPRILEETPANYIFTEEETKIRLAALEHARANGYRLVGWTSTGVLEKYGEDDCPVFRPYLAKLKEEGRTLTQVEVDALQIPEECQ